MFNNEYTNVAQSVALSTQRVRFSPQWSAVAIFPPAVTRLIARALVRRFAGQATSAPTALRSRAQRASTAIATASRRRCALTGVHRRSIAPRLLRSPFPAPITTMRKEPPGCAVSVPLLGARSSRARTRGRAASWNRAIAINHPCRV